MRNLLNASFQKVFTEESMFKPPQGGMKQECGTLTSGEGDRITIGETQSKKSNSTKWSAGTSLEGMHTTGDWTTL